MANCPSCQHQVSILFYSFRASAFLGNLFRSPANKIFVCRNCGQQLKLTTASFIFCQVAFIAIVIPCAIGFARLHVWLVNSIQLFHQLSEQAPNAAVVFLWVLPTLLVSLFIYNSLAKQFVEFQKADS